MTFYHMHLYYRSVPGKRPWALKHNSQVWAAWELTRDQIPYICIELLQWPLEMWYMGTYPGVGACPGHDGIYNEKYFSDDHFSFI